MTVFSERLKELRKEKGLTADKAAEEIGIQRSTLSNYENGTRYPRRKAMDAILDFYNVDQAYLEGRTDIKNRYGFQGIYNRGYNQGLKDAHSNSASPNHDASNVTFLESPGPVVPIKVYGSVPAGVLSNHHAYFANIAEGDSMTPKIKNGDVLIFEQEDTIDNGLIGSFSLNGEYYCKRFRRLADGSVWLVSENQAYDPIPVKPDDSFRVLGVYRLKISKEQ